MKRKRGHKGKKVAKKRRVWSDGTAGGSRIATFGGNVAWLRPLAILIAMSAVLALGALYFVKELPLLESYLSNMFTNRKSSYRDATLAPSQIEPPSALAADEAPRQQSGVNVAQENLQVTVVGAYLKVVNEGETPIHLTRVVQNRRYRVAWCDTNANVNTNPRKSSTFIYKVDQVLQIGDSYKSSPHSACGNVSVVEVYTDQGDATFSLSP